MERSDLVMKIMDEQSMSYSRAMTHLNTLIANVHYIVCFYKYYEWALENELLPEFKLTALQRERLADVVEDMPFYKKDPVLNVRLCHIVALSKRSLFREFCRKFNVKYKIEQVMFCSVGDITKLNNVLSTKRGKYDLNLHTH